jgi:hypothetical protein
MRYGEWGEPWKKLADAAETLQGIALARTVVLISNNALCGEGLEAALARKPRAK